MTSTLLFSKWGISWSEPACMGIGIFNRCGWGWICAGITSSRGAVSTIVNSSNVLYVTSRSDVLVKCLSMLRLLFPRCYVFGQDSPARGCSDWRHCRVYLSYEFSRIHVGNRHTLPTRLSSLHLARWHTGQGIVRAAQTISGEWHKS